MKIDAYALLADIRRAKDEYFRVCDLHGYGSAEADSARSKWESLAAILTRYHDYLRAA